MTARGICKLVSMKPLHRAVVRYVMRAFANKVSHKEGAMTVQTHSNLNQPNKLSALRGNSVIISKPKITSYVPTQLRNVNIHILNRKRGKSTEDRKSLAGLEPHLGYNTSNLQNLQSNGHKVFCSGSFGGC